MDDIEIYEYRRLDLRDSFVIDGFPSVGLVSTITASYIVAALDMELIGVMDSVYFPTVSVIRDGEPHHPVRFYAGDLEGPDGDWTRLVVFLSEFQPPSNLIKLICNTMLDWAQEQKCSCLISPEGLVIEGEGQAFPQGSAEGGGENDKENVVIAPPQPSSIEKTVYGLSSTSSGKDRLQRSNISIFPEGLISGIPGVLLNEGKKRNFEVTCLLAEAKDNIPDARAAAGIIEVLKNIIPYLEIDLAPLYAEADLLEAKMRGYQKISKPGGKKTIPSPSMYG
ncbi:MAG: proteasome assembly chaperone family protein [Candidatus Thermoplasmatota archaeon]|nr:proteasome assembly chaperone family protein [Candidatus Thermoplasmatota archaeon]